MKKLGIFILLIIIIGVGVYVVSTTGTKGPLSNSPSPTLSAEKPEAIPSIDASDLRSGGSSYKEEKGIYTFLYPSDYVLDESDKQHIRVYKTGSTQRGQTEMYDGVLVVFEVVPLEGMSLGDWLDTRIKTTTSDGTLAITEPKKSIMLNTYPGFTYATRGLGEAKNYIFQKDSNATNAVLISTAVNDPGNVGFQEEVDKIISTLEIAK